MAALPRETTAMKRILNSQLLVLNQAYGFQKGSGCQQNVKLSKLLDLEDAMVNNAKLFLGSENISTVLNNKGTFVSITVGDGGALPSQTPTAYGNVVLLHPDVSRRLLSNQKVMSMVISYKNNPFYTQVSENISVPVITTKFYRADGTDVSDLNFILDFPLTSETGIANNMKDMITNGTHFMAAIPGDFFDSSSVMVFVDVSTKVSCQTYGKYGTTSPTNKVFDFYLYTAGLFSVKKYRPYGLIFSFTDGIIQLPLRQTPVVFVAQCQERQGRRKGSTNNDKGVVLPIGFAEVSPKVIDRQRGEWRSDNHLQLIAGKLSEIKLQSHFFGTFSAGVKILAPDQIDFQSVFLNFSEKVIDTPYVLGTIIAVIIALIITTPLFHRRDRIDSALWSYQHLIDNKTDSLFYYYICISTGVRSSRQMNSSVYINIIGTIAETGPRRLAGNTRKNFTNGSSSHFCLTTKTYLGNIRIVKIWLGQTDKSQSWYLRKLIIVDGQRRNAVQLKCNKWLSLEKGTGHTWRTLYVKRNTADVTTVFEVSANNMFDHNLWFSLIFRPSYSRFTRVQRLWSIVSLLFLSMIASAMFYDTSNYTSPLITIAGFELGFKEIYTGCMSSVLTVLPCLIMTYIFNYRKRRGEENTSILYDGNSLRSSGRLPWWSIFIAYTVLLICISAGSFFTFLYSLEWGPSLTIKWMSSFFLGTTESVLFIEPTKVIILAVITVFFGSLQAHQKDFNIPSTSLQIKHREIYRNDHSPPEVIDCPCDKPETAVQRRRRYMLRIDRKLNRLMRKMIMGIIYVGMLLVICSQQKVSEVFQQNFHLKNILKPTQKINTMDDVWSYIQTVVMQRLSPVEFYNGKVKSPGEMRFVGTNYRMGPIRIRQIRVSGICTAPSLMKTHGITCIPNYDKNSEDKKDYNEGWITANMSDKLEDSVLPYRYQNGNDKETPPYSGHFGTYGEGGYLADLDFEPAKAIDVVNRLQSNVWLDERTRALFIELCLVNRNNLFFSQIQIVFEFPGVGGIFTESTVVSSNLYHYKDTFDFIILGLQVVFAIVIILRFVLFIVKIIQTRGSSLVTFSQVVVMFDLVVSVAAIVCLVMRFTSTVAILNTLRHDIGFYSSFGYVFEFDSYVSVCLGIITCIAILDLLQHLSFNYYCYLMYRTITAFRVELFNVTMFLAMLIIGFSSLIHLMYGHMEEKFKSISSGILTLFKMTIGMIKFRNDLELEVFGIVLIIAIYALVITLVYMNIFTSALNYNLSNIKELIRKGKTSFDRQLNQHFWNKLASRLSLYRTTKTMKEKEQRETQKLSEIDLQQAELSIHRFLSKIDELSANDVELQKKFFQDTLLPSRHFEGPNYIWSVRRETAHGVQYRFSKSWSHGDNVFVLEFLNEKVNCGIYVECVPILEALNRGLIAYGHSTHPVSSFYIVNIKNCRQKACKVMLKVSSVLLSSKPAFLITGCSDPTQWQQHTAKHIKTDETGVYLSILLPMCPQYFVAVTSDLWPGIQNIVQQEHVKEFVLTSKKIAIQPGPTKSMFVSFPSNAVASDTIIRTLMESDDRFPILHVLASNDVSGPILVEYYGKDRTNQLSDESFMKLQLLTKTGDLEWKQGGTWRRKPELDNIVELKSLKAGVKTAITVRLSDYKISLARIANRSLGREKETLINIYKKKIPTRHWRQIGRSIGISLHKLAGIERGKPRSLEEKTCLVLGIWLKENRRRSLHDIKKIWQYRVL